MPLPTNRLIQSVGNTINGLIPTVTNLPNVGGVVPTVNQTVNALITPPAQAQPAGSTNPTSQGGSTSTTSTTQYSTTSNTNSTALPETTNPSAAAGTVADIANRKDVLVLDHANTASGKIVLTKDINEVVFLAVGRRRSKSLVFKKLARMIINKTKNSYSEPGIEFVVFELS